MFKRLLKIGWYILFELLGAAAFGVLLYLVFTWLAGFSLLYAYFGTLAFMLLAIVFEEWSIRLLESDSYLKKMSERKGMAERFRANAEGFAYNTSIKTMLYLFYIFILIFSKIAEYNPTLVEGDVSTFILSNNYSILLLIALDMLVEQVSGNRARMKRLSIRVKEYFSEDQD